MIHVPPLMEFPVHNCSRGEQYINLLKLIEENCPNDVHSIHFSLLPYTLNIFGLCRVINSKSYLNSIWIIDIRLGILCNYLVLCHNSRIHCK